MLPTFQSKPESSSPKLPDTLEENQYYQVSKDGFWFTLTTDYGEKLGTGKIRQIFSTIQELMEKGISSDELTTHRQNLLKLKRITIQRISEKWKSIPIIGFIFAYFAERSIEKEFHTILTEVQTGINNVRKSEVERAQKAQETAIIRSKILKAIGNHEEHFKLSQEEAEELLYTIRYARHTRYYGDHPPYIVRFDPENERGFYISYVNNYRNTHIKCTVEQNKDGSYNFSYINVYGEQRTEKLQTFITFHPGDGYYYLNISNAIL